MSDLQSDRENDALATIRTLLGSLEQAHEMIGHLTRTIMAMNARLEALEKGSKGGKKSSLILPELTTH